MAQQVKVPAEEFTAYDWADWAIKRHRMEVGAAFGFRECTDGHADRHALAPLS